MIWKQLATTSFLIYIFFVFFGTSLPFQEQVTELEDIATANPINQFVFSTLYLVSFFSLIQKKSSIIAFIKKEKFLTLFLLWCLLSIAWSDYPLVSLKRCVQVVGTTIVFLSALLHLSHPDESIPYFRWVLMLYIPISLICIAIVPGAIQWEFPAWRGIAVHKNTLGQISLISLIFWSYGFQKLSFNRKIVTCAFWVLSFVLLLGSVSATALITAILLFMMWIPLYLVNHWIGPNEKKWPMIFMAGCLVICSVSLLTLWENTPSDIVGAFGKDITLTGRVDLWERIFEYSREHLFIGSGFEGFWIPTNPVLEDIAESLYWIPNESHLGYLDILNETGVIGIVLLILMLFSFFTNLLKLSKPFFWKWFVIAVIILNLSESTLFRLHSLTGVLFTFSYIALYVELIRLKNG